MARKRRRNRETELFVARKQAAPLRVYGDERETAEQKMLALIDAKGGDYFRPSLHPQGEAAHSAWDHMAYTGVKTPLQKELVAQARLHYGLDAPATVEPLGVDYSKGIPEKTIKVIPSVSKAPTDKAQLAPKVEVTPEALINITKPQGPKAPPAQGPKRAQQFKDEAVQEIIEQNPEAIQQLAVEQIAADLNKSTDNFKEELNKINAKDNNELSLYLAALLLGGTGIAMSSQNNEPQLSEEELIALKEAGII